MSRFSKDVCPICKMFYGYKKELKRHKYKEHVY